MIEVIKEFIPTSTKRVYPPVPHAGAGHPRVRCLPGYRASCQLHGIGGDYKLGHLRYP